MRRSVRRVSLLSAIAALGLTACEGGEKVERYRATLSGASEVPARTTTATGSAEFIVNNDNTISFTLDVTGLQNVFAAHIHGPATTTENAGVIASLFTTTPPRSGSFTGRLAEGTLTNTNNPQQVSMDSLLVLFRNGRAYVNVHTNDMAGSANTGPGDFAAGELRGQITPVP